MPPGTTDGGIASAPCTLANLAGIDEPMTPGTMSADQPCRPARTPAGGQWAPAQHTEADIDLGPVMTQLLDGTRAWLRDGRLHRTDGPAIEWADGTHMWYQDGRLHRTDGPAVEYPDGTREWYQDDERHRTDGPALEAPHGTRMWYQHDQLHRTDGPAVEYHDGTRQWWAHGKLLYTTRPRA